jgi:hypothetical protein
MSADLDPTELAGIWLSHDRRLKLILWPLESDGRYPFEYEGGAGPALDRMTPADAYNTLTTGKMVFGGPPVRVGDPPPKPVAPPSRGIRPRP